MIVTTPATTTITCDGCGGNFDTSKDPSNYVREVIFRFPDTDYRGQQDGFEYRIQVHGFQCIKNWVESGVRNRLDLPPEEWRGSKNG